MSKIKNITVRFLIVTLAGCFFLAGDIMPVKAQSLSDSETVLAPDEEDDRYPAPSRQHMSKIYWALGMHNLYDDDAIDNFLNINECELFQRYYYNEFEWARIRDIQREYLKENIPNFTTNIEVIKLIYLDEYDIDEAAFDVASRSIMDGVRKMTVSHGGPSTIVCGKQVKYVEGYPAHMLVVLNRPFTFKKVPVPNEIAQYYLLDVKERFKDASLRRKQNVYKREAYLRLLIKLRYYKETIQSRILGEYAPRAVIFGALEGYEVYADPEKKLLMYKGEPKYTYKGRRRTKKNSAGEENLETNDNQAVEESPDN